MITEQNKDLEQFKFLQEYDKESVLKYIGALHLYKANSSFASRLSRLTIQTLLNCCGDKLVNDSFGAQIVDNYTFEMSEDPQEFLFVDTVHSTRKTYRVFPGIFSNLQDNLTRYFSIAFNNKINEESLKYSLFFLHVSECIAEQIGYNNHEIGEPLEDSMFFPSTNEVKGMEPVYIYDYQNIINIAKLYNISEEEFNDLLYLHNDELLKAFDEDMLGYSPVETNPLYKLSNGQILVIQPSALLSAAHYYAINVLYDRLESFDSIYNDELTLELSHCSNEVERTCLGRGGVDTAMSLLLRIDKDKLLVPVIITDRRIFLQFDKFNNGLEKYLSDKYNAYKIHIVYCYNTTEVGLSFGFRSNVILFDFDDFRKVLKLSNFSLNDLWYYCEDRCALPPHVHGQEIDLLEFYRNNQRTFYMNRYANVLIPVIGNALQLRFESSCSCDEQVLTFKGVSARIQHFPDFPQIIPIYRGTNITTQNELIGKLIDSTIIFYVKPNPEYETICFEIVKSILIWLHVVEVKFQEPIISGEISVIVELDETLKEPTLLYSDVKNLYRFQIPPNKYLDNYKDIEISIISSFLSCMLGNNEYVNPHFTEMLKTIFSECEGHILQGPDYPDVLLEDDGIRDVYEVNDRCCDIVLSEIANLLQHFHSEILLSRDESRKTALNIQKYLGEKIDCILEDIASNLFFEYMLRLHHSMQFWKFNVNSRFYNINLVMNYIGGMYENQLHSAEQYTLTDGIVCFLIERIVSKNIQSPKSNIPSNEQIDMLFAYAKQYNTVCQYIDLWSKISEGTELRILDSGRICFPTDLLDNYMSNFKDQRKENFFLNKELNIKQDLFPEFRIKKTDNAFFEAFTEEYGLTFEEYIAICQRSIDYGIKNGGVINLAIDDFNKIIVSSNEDAYVSNFYQRFVLFYELKEQQKFKDSEFWPHRYNRKFQISTRPWIKYKDRIYFSNKSVSMSSRILLERISSGILVARSKKMTSYLGNIKRQKGKVFNDEVCSYVKSNCLPGVIVKQEVPIKPGKDLCSEKDLGDIDILIIDTSHKIIKAIELKNYMECRYLWKVIEQENQLKEDLGMVQSRSEWCKSNLKKFAFLNKEIDDTYKFETLFLTYNLPPNVFRRNEEYQGIRFITILDVINNPNILCCKSNTTKD